MVRRAAAQQLGKLAAVVEPEIVSRDLVPLFLELTQDEQDSVRLLAVEACGEFAKLLGRGDVTTHVLPVVQKFSQDKSWRVRYNVAQQLHFIGEALGPELGRQELTPCFLRLMRDGETEVRVAAAGKTAAFCGSIKFQGVAALMPVVKELAADPAQNVRAALASSVLDMAPDLGKADTITHVVPIVLQLLKDEVRGEGIHPAPTYPPPSFPSSPSLITSYLFFPPPSSVLPRRSPTCA